jgi:tripartite ATP-independent transporter DctP family solute receptor
MKRTLLKSMLGVAVLAATTLAAGPALAQTKLKFAHVYETSEAYHSAALWAAEEIKKRTNGRYEIEVFPASQLGKETDINQGLTLGTVDVIYTGQAFAARTLPALAIGGAPFMFRDLDHWKKYADSDLLRDLMEAYYKKGGNKPLAVTYYGVRHTTANKAIMEPKDMVGLKLRVPDAPLYVMYPKVVGANATPIAFAEVYLALQSKTVDAQENPLPTIEAKKFYEVQSHINLTGHISEMLLTIVSGQTWNKLSDADKKVFESVFKEAGAKATSQIEASEAKLVGDFATKYNKTVVKSDRAAFAKAFEKEHMGSYATWDKATYDRLQAIK